MTHTNNSLERESIPSVKVNPDDPFFSMEHCFQTIPRRYLESNSCSQDQQLLSRAHRQLLAMCSQLPQSDIVGNTCNTLKQRGAVLHGDTVPCFMEQSCIVWTDL